MGTTILLAKDGGCLQLESGAKHSPVLPKLPRSRNPSLSAELRDRRCWQLVDARHLPDRQPQRIRTELRSGLHGFVPGPQLAQVSGTGSPAALAQRCRRWLDLELASW